MFSPTGSGAPHLTASEVLVARVRYAVRSGQRTSRDRSGPNSTAPSLRIWAAAVDGGSPVGAGDPQPKDVPAHPLTDLADGSGPGLQRPGPRVGGTNYGTKKKEVELMEPICFA